MKIPAKARKNSLMKITSDISTCILITEVIFLLSYFLSGMGTRKSWLLPPSDAGN